MVGFTDFAREHETALEVSVSEECDGDGNGDERFDGVASADHVFIFVERGAVDELDAGEVVDVDGTLRKRAEPFKIFGSELVSRPERGEAGDGVEVLEIHEAADGFVVIAADENASQRLRFGNDFVRIAAVADRVSEIDDEVVSRSGSQTGVQRFEVAVNVAEKKDTHKGRIIAFLEGKRCGCVGWETMAQVGSGAVHEAATFHQLSWNFLTGSDSWLWDAACVSASLRSGRK